MFSGEDSACLRRMDKEEELIAKANQELEKALKDVKPKAQEATEAALKVRISCFINFTLDKCCYLRSLPKVSFVGLGLL